jgi:hypothetical protein
VDVETGVHTAIRKIRLALRDSPEAPNCVETVTGKGYRFIAPVETGAAAPAGSLPPTEPLPPTTEGAPPAPPPGARVAGRPRTHLALGFLAAAVVAGLAYRAWTGDRTPPSRVTVAVLPFENLSGDADRE